MMMATTSNDEIELRQVEEVDKSLFFMAFSKDTVLCLPTLVEEK